MTQAVRGERRATGSGRGVRAGAAAVFAALIVLGAAACGDSPRAGRGYTQAPLGRPGVVPRAEQRSAVRAHGEPNYTRAPLIELPDVTPTPDRASDVAVPVTLPPGVNAEMVTAGQQLYGGQGNCHMCHGPAGTGSPIGPALNDTDWLHIDGSLDAIARIIADGVPAPARYPAPMPALGGAQLSEAQVRQIAAYVYTLSH